MSYIVAHRRTPIQLEKCAHLRTPSTDTSTDPAIMCDRKFFGLISEPENRKSSKRRTGASPVRSVVEAALTRVRIGCYELRVTGTRGLNRA